MFRKKGPPPDQYLPILMGGTTASERRKQESALDLLDRRHKLLDTIINFDERIKAVEGSNPAVEKFLNDRFNKIILQFEATFDLKSETEVGERDLQRAAEVRRAENEGEVKKNFVDLPGELVTDNGGLEFITGEARLAQLKHREKNATEDEKLGVAALPGWHPKRVIVGFGAGKRAKQHQAMADKRLIARVVAATHIEKTWKEKLVNLEKQMADLAPALNGLELVRAAVGGTSMQIVAAKSCQVALERWARNPEDVEAKNILHTRTAELTLALNIQERAVRLLEELREIGIEMEREQAILDADLKGIESVGNILGKRISSSAEEAKQIKQELITVGKNLQTAYEAATATLAGLENKFKSLTDPYSSVDKNDLQGEVEAFSAIDLRQFLIADFTAACGAARAVLDKLRAKMQIKKSPELPRPAEKLLSSVETVSQTTKEADVVSPRTRPMEPTGYEEIVRREAARPIVEVLKEQAELFKSVGLPEWAEAAYFNIGRLEINSDLRATIDRKRAEGKLVVAMPSRDVILATTPQLLTAFLPTDVENNRPANPTHIGWDYITKLMNNRGVKSAERDALVADIPNTPHFMDFIPSEGPPADSCNKTLAQQIAWVAQQKQVNPTTTDMKLPQYLIAQFLLTHKDGKPMDANTWTRFITVQKGGWVAGGGWDPMADGRRLGFGRGVGGAYADGGVRLAGMN